MKQRNIRAQRIGLCTVSGIARRYGLARPTVMHAIRIGKLPCYLATTEMGRDLYLVKPADADVLWGTRVKPLPHDPELIPA